VVVGGGETIRTSPRRAETAQELWRYGGCSFGDDVAEWGRQGASLGVLRQSLAVQGASPILQPGSGQHCRPQGESCSAVRATPQMLVSRTAQQGWIEEILSQLIKVLKYMEHTWIEEILREQDWRSSIQQASYILL
jgi:hypothetical protein